MLLEFAIADTVTGEVTAHFIKNINLETEYGKILLHNELDLFIRKLKTGSNCFFQLGVPQSYELELPF